MALELQNIFDKANIMGKAKKVSLATRPTSFSNQKQAQDYYYDIVKALFAKKITISNGQDFEELKEIYILYCQYTDYKLDRLASHEIIGFTGDYTRRNNNERYSTTICCKVLFSNKTDTQEDEFSIYTAIREIANKQNRFDCL